MPLLPFLKRNYFPILIVIAVVVIGVFFVDHKEKTSKRAAGPMKDKVEYGYPDSGETTDTLEKFGLCANENFVVREDAEVRRTPNIAMYNTVYKLKFGTKVYTKNADKESNIKADDSLLERETRNGFVAVYSVKPVMLSDVPVGYMLREDIIEKSEFKNYKPQEPKAPPLIIPDDIKAVIESHLTIEGINYKVIENEERFNNSLCYGDFNNDGMTDFAVLLDKADNSGTALLVYVQQPNKKTYSLVYSKLHPTLLKIKTIAKNTQINVDYEMTSFAVDGILITNAASATFFQVYDTRDKSFTVFKS